MTKNTVNEKERMVITRVFDAPRAWLEGVDRPAICDAVVGPKGLQRRFAKIDFRVGGKFLCCMKSPDGQEAGMAENTTRLFRTRRSFTRCTLPTRRETRLSLRSMESNMRP